MKSGKFLIFLFCVLSFKALATEVPTEIEFAGIQLRLTEEVRRSLKADIDMITKSPKAFQNKVDRANLYFPIIERVFKEEGFPDDFKFLALQESSLVSDAVSSSNAVGYWQFKKESAQEVGLRVDHHIDERMNIVAASRGAAKYIKKNNALLNNWVYALLSYNLGLGGVKSHVEEKYVGSHKMTIDKNMHWYVIRFLAHKIAYENAVGRDFNPSLLLITYDECNNKSLHEIARETEIEPQNMDLYNKWVLRDKIPTDKTYYVILPVTPQHKELLVAKNIIKSEQRNNLVADNNTVKPNHTHTHIDSGKSTKDKKRKGSSLSGTGDVGLITFVNRVRAIKAKEGDSPAKLANQVGIATEDFLRYNDLKSFETIVPGKIYFLQPKRKKAIVLFYTVQEGETLRDISQQFGISVNSIRSKNRIKKTESLEAGRVLWLRSKRPKSKAIEYKKIRVVPKEEPLKNDVQTINKKEEKIVKDSSVFNNTESKQPIITKDSVIGGVYHEVMAGETLYGISKSFAVPIDSIKLWNRLGDNSIKLGTRLLVGKNTSDAQETVISHIVSPGETLYQISRKYNVKVDDILKWNGKTEANIAIGEKLNIKKKP